MTELSVSDVLHLTRLVENPEEANALVEDGHIRVGSCRHDRDTLETIRTDHQITDVMTPLAAYLAPGITAHNDGERIVVRGGTVELETDQRGLTITPEPEPDDLP